jgi:sugar/nucleoside kinase (ribokinase family)
MKRVLVAGEINVDLVFAGCTALPEFGRETLAPTFRQTPGSSAMICALGLARLGNDVRFVGRCGADAWGNYCLAALRDAGIDVAAAIADPSLTTGVTVAISSHTDRALLTYPGATAALLADDVAAALAGAAHLHVTSFYLQERLRPQLGELFARAKAAGMTTSLDPGSDPAQRWDSDVVDVLRHVDLFFPNYAEAGAITGHESPEAALLGLAFASDTTLTVVKLGEHGAMAFDGERVLTVAAPAADVVDTTGAGDSFDAGFLHAWLRDLPLAECLAWGNACGALSTRGIGGTTAQPSADEVLAVIGTAP